MNVLAAAASDSSWQDVVICVAFMLLIAVMVIKG